MKCLKVAEEICREVQGNWDYNLIERQRGSYRCKFPCPECGKEARETMTTVKTGKGIESELWRFRWSSKCGHVSGEEELVACVTLPVEENGVTVGLIEPVAPPEWPRYECTGRGSINYKLPCAWFGTLGKRERPTCKRAECSPKSKRSPNQTSQNLGKLRQPARGRCLSSVA